MGVRESYKNVAIYENATRRMRTLLLCNIQEHNVQKRYDDDTRRYKMYENAIYKNTDMHKNVTRYTRMLQEVRERCYFAMYKKLCTRGYARVR